MTSELDRLQKGRRLTQLEFIFSNSHRILVKLDQKYVVSNLLYLVRLKLMLQYRNQRHRLVVGIPERNSILIEFPSDVRTGGRRLPQKTPCRRTSSLGIFEETERLSYSQSCCNRGLHCYIQTNEKFIGLNTLLKSGIF